jgi:small subunit ribosomal protein S10
MVLVLKSFNKNLLNFFINSILLPNLSFSVKVIFLPSRSKKWTVLKSPHVNSKAKEQFEMVTHSRLLKLSGIKKSELVYFINFLKINIIPGISVKNKYNF